MSEDKIVECRAGKCMLQDRTVISLPQKGLLSLLKGPESGTLTMQWVPRLGEAPVIAAEIEEWILMPGAKISHCTKCTTGKVLLVEQPDADPILFWIQEKDPEDAETYIICFAETAGAELCTGDPTHAAQPSSTAQVPQTTSEAGLQLLSQLYNAQQEQPSPKCIALDRVVTTSLLTTLSEDPEAVADLKELLPEEAKADSSAVAKLLHSSHLIHATRDLSHALLNGEVAPLFAALGLDQNIRNPDGTQIRDPTLLLIRALEHKYGKQ